MLVEEGERADAVDGVWAVEEFNLGAVGDLSDLPIANVDNITLLRGPQSLRFGADASGGVVVSNDRIVELVPQEASPFVLMACASAVLRLSASSTLTGK